MVATRTFPQNDFLGPEAYHRLHPRQQELIHSPGGKSSVCLPGSINFLVWSSAGNITQQTKMDGDAKVIPGYLVPLACDFHSWYTRSHADLLPTTHFSGAGTHPL